MTDEKPEALRLAGQLEAGDIHECAWQAAAELRRLHMENADLKNAARTYSIVIDERNGSIAALEAEAENYRSVMVAAAEEIHEHWDAHCDAEGYGPANLMHRLEKGIPAEYAYKAGDFAKQDERIAALEKALTQAVEALERALDREHNPFEPDNQSHHYKRLVDAITAARQTLG